MISIVEYGMGNSGSISNMLAKIGRRSIITSSEEDILNSTHIILPGVGSFDNGVKSLSEYGLDTIIKKAVNHKRIPFLGICLGMQLLFRDSEEGSLQGLDLIPGKVIKFRRDSSTQKLPHMGWNSVYGNNTTRLFQYDEADQRYYFVHSYHVMCDSEYVIGKTSYIYEFPSAVALNNIYGVQFHPEKSHKFGIELFKSFTNIV